MDLKLLLLLVIIFYAEAYKILLLAPMPIRSLNILGEGYVRHLTEAGHEVTYITVYPIKNKIKNLRQIDLSNTHQNLIQNDNALNIGYIMQNREMKETDIAYVQNMGVGVAAETFKHEAVMDFLEDTNEKFDVVISELLESEIYSALAALYDCPMIWAYSMGAHWPALRLIDRTTNPAYASDYISPSTDRLKKLWDQIQWTYNKWFNIIPAEEALYEQTFKPLFAKRGRALPSYRELIYNSSFVFANDFLGNDYVPSVPQNFKLIGGYHIELPPKPLPNNIQTILENSKHGFIYFSMGSTWKSKDIPKSVTRGLLEMFGELKQTVLWKYEEDLQDLPKNVHVLKWAPQTSILAHPKCLFFISHGGHLSSTEAVHFGVPVIGVPIYFDQFINIKKAVGHGYAIQVDLTLDLPNNLREAIKQMLENPMYKQKVNDLSAIYHDRVVPPGKELVHWVEHVIKTKGATHLRTPAFYIPWYEKYYIDYIVISIVILLFFSHQIKKLFSLNKKYNINKKRK